MTKVLAQGAQEPLGRCSLNLHQDAPAMPTSQELHKIVALRPMIQANLFLLLDALTHVNLLATRRVFLGKQRYDVIFKWDREPYVEDDYKSNGDLGIAGLVRGVIKALEAQGRGFAHGHEEVHSDPCTKAIDLIMLFCGVTEHANTEERLESWMRGHRHACLSDACTKQYDSAVESARQLGYGDLKEVCTAEERKSEARWRMRRRWEAT